ILERFTRYLTLDYGKKPSNYIWVGHPFYLIPVICFTQQAAGYSNKIKAMTWQKMKNQSALEAFS
ncbi:MAG: hypothetical protein MUO26_08790, partial [Methanotrichaceae archaeon]|nr:hypothetical protein [Methanotrichaceae archaeon]